MTQPTAADIVSAVILTVFCIGIAALCFWIGNGGRKK